MLRVQKAHGIKKEKKKVKNKQQQQKTKHIPRDCTCFSIKKKTKYQFVLVGELYKKRFQVLG